MGPSNEKIARMSCRNTKANTISDVIWKKNQPTMERKKGSDQTFCQI